MDHLRDAYIPDEQNCQQIRERHADYTDGLLPPALAAQVQSHLDACSSCARYDRLIRRSVDLVHMLPDVQPSDDFELRLQHRLFHVRDDAALADQRAAGVRTAAVVAGMIALLAWSPLLLDRGPTEQPVRVADNPVADDPFVPLSAVAPLAPPANSWFPGQAPALVTFHPRGAAVFPGPYSPLIVDPPVHGGAVRTISTEYRAYE